LKSSINDVESAVTERRHILAANFTKSTRPLQIAAML